MTVFDFDNYKEFVVKRIQAMPKKGHGQFRKMANFLSINSVNVTQIFKGDRNLSPEQACLLADFFGFSELETQYFVFLVEKERAGHFKLKKMIQRRLDEIRLKSQDLKQRLKSEGTLSEEAKALFYANWYNSGIRLLTSIEGYQNPDAIAKYFGLPLSTVNRALEFLLQTGLCVQKNGKIRMGPSSTHLEASSPLINRHHTNWRVKAIESFDQIAGRNLSQTSSEELCLSMPCSVSNKDMLNIRKELIETIERITALVDKGPEEKLACLNIDWFNV